MFIVSVLNRDMQTDYYRFDTIEAARKKYLPLVSHEETLTASLSVEICSTDYMGNVIGIWEEANNET